MRTQHSTNQVDADSRLDIEELLLANRPSMPLHTRRKAYRKSHIGRTPRPGSYGRVKIMGRKLYGMPHEATARIYLSADTLSGGCLQSTVQELHGIYDDAAGDRFERRHSRNRWRHMDMTDTPAVGQGGPSDSGVWLFNFRNQAMFRSGLGFTARTLCARHP
jgi:hypothetical protein